jgi:hypothetical protein
MYGSGGIGSSFFISELGGGEWSASSSSHFTVQDRAPDSHCIAECVGLRAGLDVVKKNIYSLPRIEPGRPARSLVTRISMTMCTAVFLCKCNFLSQFTWSSLCGVGVWGVGCGCIHYLTCYQMPPPGVQQRWQYLPEVTWAQSVIKLKTLLHFTARFLQCSRRLHFGARRCYSAWRQDAHIR